MATAPAWLREAFRDGVDETIPDPLPPPAYVGADPLCWLAQFDPNRLPCTGQPGKVFERFHFIPRQRVEEAVFALLPYGLDPADRAAIIRVAAWDSRNAELGCEHHHRRLDSHACSSRAPQIVVPYSALPTRVVHFAFDYGIDAQLDRFPSSI